MLLRILGIVVMFADDGTPTVRDADDDNVGDKTEEEHETRVPDAKDEVAPPDDVEDFTDPEAFGDIDDEFPCGCIDYCDCYDEEELEEEAGDE